MRTVLGTLLLAGCLLCRVPVHAQLDFPCTTFGEDCAAELTDGTDEHASTVTIPSGACALVGSVRVEVAARHTWVGDLRATLAHGGRSVALFNRPGQSGPLPYGCPGEGVDVVIDEGAGASVQTACDVTVPALDDSKRSPGYGRRLIVDPNGVPFNIAGCPFERFEGTFVGVQQGGSVVAAPFCPHFFDRDTGNTPCVFRGRWNQDCGSNNLQIRFTSDGDLVRLALLNVGSTVEFRGTEPAATVLDLDFVQVGTQVSARDGDAALEELGLSAFTGLACAGDWTLTVADTARPNRGRLDGWSLQIVPQPTATPTPTNTLTPTVTATPTRTGTPTPTATDSPTLAVSVTATPTVSVTVVASPTATETSVVTPSVTPTDTPLGGPTATPTEETTSTPTGSPSENIPTATVAPGGCVGDCDGNGSVAVNELVLGVNIALEQLDLSLCPAFDVDGSNTVAVNELVTGVGNALNECPA